MAVAVAVADLASFFAIAYELFDRCGQVACQ